MAYGAGGQVGTFGKSKKLPPGALVLTEGEVLDMHFKMIQKWQPRSEIWPFTYGVGVQGGLAVLTGISGNLHYRRVLRLLHYGRWSTYAPAVILPTFSAVMLHHVYITQPIFLQKFDCAVCAEVRAACVQTFSGFVVPWTISILGCLALAKTKHTLPVPHFLNFKAFSEFMWKKTRPVQLNMMGLLAVNFLGAIFITSQEMQTAPKIWRRMGVLDSPSEMAQKETDD